MMGTRARTEAEVTRLDRLDNAALAALAVFEHWMLMLPVPVEKLWKWSLPVRQDAAKSRNSISPKFDYTPLKAALRSAPDGL